MHKEKRNHPIPIPSVCSDDTQGLHMVGLKSCLSADWKNANWLRMQEHKKENGQKQFCILVRTKMYICFLVGCHFSIICCHVHFDSLWWSWHLCSKATIMHVLFNWLNDFRQKPANVFSCFYEALLWFQQKLFKVFCSNKWKTWSMCHIIRSCLLKIGVKIVWALLQH